jgi:phosphoglycolate phosphatase
MRVQATTYGRLDPDIYRDTLLAHDLDPAAHPFPAFATALTAEYAAHAGELREQGCALPGAADALDAVAGDPLAVQTVLTGNLRAVARIKLAAFDLDRRLDLAIGAYALDAQTRAALVPIAQRRAGAKHRAVFDGDTTVVIGDSHHDVAAARAAGVRVVAVATGRETAAELVDADVVLEDLSDTAEVLRAVL